MTWENVVESCPLCDMEKRTEWYKETEEFVVAEKLGGGPFVVIKDHVEEPTNETINNAHDVVQSVFGEHKFRVLMNIVEDHWHAHIIKKEDRIDLSDE